MKLYHWTSMDSLIEIAKTKAISMSLAIDSATELSFAKGKYPFFLSTTQYGTVKEGYQKESELSVRLELDSSYMTNKGVFSRINYYRNTPLAFKVYESEDRFLTKHPFLPFDKAVLSVKAFEGQNSMLTLLKII